MSKWTRCPRQPTDRARTWIDVYGLYYECARGDEETVAALVYAADDVFGVVQAPDMVRLLPGLPHMHNATLLGHALGALGARRLED